MAHDEVGVEPAMSVEALLAEPLLRGTLRGGESGLANAVAWCLPLSEVEPGGQPDAVASTRDLVGVAVHLDATHLAGSDRSHALVGSLAKRGVAALIVWPGHGREPANLDAAAGAADATSVPLIAVTREADFRRTNHLVATKVLAQETHVLEYSVRVHRTLGEVFAHGSGLGAMARTMSQLSRTPVLVVGLKGDVLAHADVTRPGTEPPGNAGFADLVPRVLAEHSNDRAQAAASGLGSAPHARIMEVEFDGETTHAVVAQVTVAGEAYGMVALVERRWPAAEHDLAQHTVIADQGATLAGSELLRQHSVIEAEERARDDFVAALLHGRFTDQHELEARSRHYRFNPDGRYAVFVVTSPALRPGRTPGNQRPSEAIRAVGAATANSDQLTLTALIGWMVVVIHELPTGSPHPAEVLADRDARRGFAEQVRRVLRDRLGDEVRVAHGRGGVGAAGVAESYREARSAAALAQRVEASPVCGYDDLRVFAAIQEVASSAPGRSFAAEVLGPLRRAHGQTGNLEEIVLAYIGESGNLNAAARRLHVHRNTMLYKLERASRALQMDVRTSETQFMVWLAHHIDTLSEIQTALDNEIAPPT